MKSIYLVGIAGVGKTTVGLCLAQCMNRPFWDLDQEVERATGKSIQEIFVVDGKARFRRLESEQLKALPTEGAVIATGGGVVLDEGNRMWLKEKGIVVRLHAAIDDLVLRVKTDISRPLLQGNIQQKLEDLMIDREAFYQEVAHITLDTTGKTPEYIATEVAKMLI